MSTPSHDRPVALSIAVMAWNEEDGIAATLNSLFEQSIFAHFAARGERVEVTTVANGCTDRTVPIARELFERQMATHPAREGLKAQVADIPELGRNNAWNRFIHEFSAREARYLLVMDADIIFNRPDTIELVVSEMERNPNLGGASDWPCKNIAYKENKSLREKMSLATSEMTGTIAGRLNGMLYCLRTEIARNLFLPRDVLANDDGFFKAAICTNFFSAPLDPTKVVSVREATHLYEPYLKFNEILRNQKRQMIGQTTVHVILGYIQTLPARERADLARTLMRFEKRDPDWLKKLIDAHVAKAGPFWNLFPGILGFRWRRLMELRGTKRITHFPAAAAGFVVTVIACWQAARFLRSGVASYWPKVNRQPVVAPPVPTVPVIPQLEVKKA